MYVVEVIGKGQDWLEAQPEIKGVTGLCPHVAGMLSMLCDAGYSLIINSTDNYAGEVTKDHTQRFILLCESIVRQN